MDVHLSLNGRLGLDPAHFEKRITNEIYVFFSFTKIVFFSHLFCTNIWTENSKETQAKTNSNVIIANKTWSLSLLNKKINNSTNIDDKLALIKDGKSSKDFWAKFSVQSNLFSDLTESSNPLKYLHCCGDP